MSEEVLIEIKSKQVVGDQEENTDVIARGVHSIENGLHHLEYDEFDSETDDKTSSKIVFDEGLAKVQRTGAFNGSLIFEKGKKRESMYSTPFGEINWDIITHDIQIEEQEKELNLKIVYELYAQNEKVSDHTISVNIKNLNDNA